MKRDVPPPGTVLGERYRVIRPLGAGAFGNVLEVEHVHTRHKRAMKLLNDEAANNPEVVERFLREASAAGRIGDRHIVETFDAGRFADGAPYLVMELLDGVTLRALVHRDRLLSVGLACELVAQAAEGIHAAHQAGIVHRDLKPENLFVLSGPLLKILDFGVSRFSAGDDLSLTQSNTPMGTPLYMAPEQFQGAKNLGREADIYSLGVVLYELLCGSPPFVADSYGALAIAVATTSPAPLSMRVDGLNPELEKIIARAMARERAARFAGADELAKALAPFREAEDTARLHVLAPQPIAPASPDEPTFRPPQKATPMQASSISPPTVPAARRAPRPKGRWLVALVALVAVAGGGWLWQHRPARPVAKAKGPIVVLPMTPSGDWRTLFAAEVIQRALAAGPHARVVPYAEGERFVRELRGKTDAAAVEAAARERLGAGPVLRVEVRERDGRVDLDVDGNLSGASDEPPLARSLKIVGADVADPAQALASELRALLELEAPAQPEQLRLTDTLPHAGAQLYAEGMRQLAQMNLAGAIDSLKQARSRDANNALVVDALSAAYDAAGEDDLAIATAQDAMKLATDRVPRPIELRIECRLRGLERDVSAVHTACGAMMIEHDDVESRLLYARGMLRIERWGEMTSALAGAIPANDPGVLIARAELDGIQHAYRAEADAGQALFDVGRSRQSPSIEAAGELAICDGARGEGQLEAARAACTAAYYRYYDLKDLVGQARAHTGLGHIGVQQPSVDGGEPLDPQTEYATALTLAQTAGSKKDEIASGIYLGSLLLQKGQLEPAIARLEATERSAISAGSGELVSMAAAELGEAQMVAAKRAQAKESYGRAIAAAHRAKLNSLEAFALQKRGRLEWRTGQLAIAQQSLHQAVLLYGNEAAKESLGYTYRYLADVYCDQGEWAGARAQLNAAHLLFDPQSPEQAWIAADKLRYRFEAGEKLDPEEVKSVVEQFASGPMSDASGEAMALALQAVGEPVPAKTVKQALDSLATETNPDAETATWVRLALAEVLIRSGDKAKATQLLAEAHVEEVGETRLTLWSELLQARLSGSAAKRASLAADARRLGDPPLAKRAEQQK